VRQTFDARTLPEGKGYVGAEKKPKCSGKNTKNKREERELNIIEKAEMRDLLHRKMDAILTYDNRGEVEIGIKCPRQVWEGKVTILRK